MQGEDPLDDFSDTILNQRFRSSTSILRIYTQIIPSVCEISLFITPLSGNREKKKKKTPPQERERFIAVVVVVVRYWGL